MVRETRHLWVGNLPENIREDRIREHFKRYGRVQSVKIFSRKGGGECEGNALVGCGSTGICATVSFMDIKSASKAHNNEHKLDEHSLTTEYHEPAAIPSAPPASAVPPSVSSSVSPVTQATPPSLRHPPPYSSPRFTHGPSEEITTFDRSSHFYERRDGTENFVRRPPSAYHVVSPSESLRGRTRERDRLYRNGPPHYTPILDSVVARTPSTHHRTVTTAGWNSYESTNCSRYSSSVVSTPEILSYQEERRESTPVIIVHKKHPKSRRKCRVMRRRGSNGSESVSNNSDSSRSRSHSSSSSSHSRSSSSSSDSSSAAISERSCSTHSHHGSLKSTVTVHSTISTPLTNCSPVVHTDDRRPLAICVRNLPARSSDSSLKDGLYHEYKKHGKVTSVKVLGQGANRYAIVCFKKADDVEKALQVSHDKLFFGSKIEVTIYHGYDVEDNDFRPIEAELDEYHPKATRTLFIGNLEKDVTVNDLRNTFQKFGEIIDIDIKKQGVTCYAFCQYCDISSVVKAMHAMDGEYLGNNKINLGYGKSLATNCLWVAGVADCVTEKQLSGSFSQFGHVTHVDIDRSQGKALVFFQQVTHAQAALSQMRGYVLKNRRLMADYASRECQENFYDNYEKSKSVISTYENNCQDSPRSTGSTRGLDTPISSTSSNGGGGSTATSKTILNTSSGNINYDSSDKLHSRYTTPTLRTTPTHQPIQQTPSSNSASPIVNNTPSPSPSTSSRSTPRPQQTSRFDYSGPECSSERRISRSLEDLNINIENTNTEKAPTPNSQDDVTLQKERVSLLEQLNDYSSSEDDDDEVELSSTKQPSSIRQHRSTSREESRPGTPLCDERPENILAHYESRRAAKEKNTNNTPLSLPLPSFANKVPRSSSPSDRSSKSPHQSKPHHVSRPPPPFESSNATRTPSSSSSSSYTRRSPSPHTKDKPSILDSKLCAITSFETLTETLKAPWIEQLKSLDEKYEKWHGTRTKVMSGKLDTSAIQVKHKLLDVNAIGRQRSEICQTVLSRKSVFDDHFKRLETITDPTPTTDLPSPRVTINNTVRSHNTLITSINNLPNVCSKPSTVNNVVSTTHVSSSTTSTSSSSSSSSSSSPSVIKGLQYPFPSHPPPAKSTPGAATPKLLLNNFNTSSSIVAKPPDTPTTNAPVTSSIHGSSTSSTRTNAVLRNNSVEKLTDLPKNPSPISSRETSSRLEPVAIDKKDILSPVTSRRSSIESIGKKSADDANELINERVSGKDKPNLKPAQDQSGENPSKIVNHEIPKTKFNNFSFENKSTTSTEKENSVLDKRKNSIDRTTLPTTTVATTIIATATTTNTTTTTTVTAANVTTCPESPECCNAVSVIFHTSQRDKLSKSLEDVSEIDKPCVNRRSSIEFHKDNRLSGEKDEKPLKKEIINNVHKKNEKSDLVSKKPNFVNSVKEPDPIKRDKKDIVNHCDKINADDKKTKPILHNHVNSGDEEDKKKETKTDKKEDKRIPSIKDIKTESVDEKDALDAKLAVIDEDDDDSNDIDDNKTTLVKNKIIETLFNVKHEKKKSQSDSKEEELVKPPKEKKKSLGDKSSHSSKEKINKKDDRSKKECIKTKEFNMFENKSLDKKKNHFLSERRKSNDLEGKEAEKSSGKHKESEQIIDKSKSEKKNKHEVKHKDEKPRKPEEKREQFDAVKVEEKIKFEEKPEKKVENVFNKTDSSGTCSSVSIPCTTKKEAPKSIVDLATKDKEKRKEKSVSQPENGKIKHDYHKKYNKEHENNKKHSSEKEPIKLDTLELEKIDLKSAQSSTNFYKSKLIHESVTRKEIERKNSSSSSSLSDSVHSKSKSSYDSVESNNEDKRHDSLSSEHMSSKRSEKHKSNSVSDGAKDDKRSDRKKSEKSGLSSKRKKSKKRKTLSDSSSDSDFESYDESKSNKKNHSIFEVVIDEPAYISMYDKVKARSTKNLQKQEEEKRQEKLKEKFNQLKQSRVKREEKKRSTSYDDDTDHEPTIRKSNKLILDSSDEEHSSNDKMTKINLHGVTDSSDDDKKKPSDDDDAAKFKKSVSRSINGKNKEKAKLTQTDTSEDEIKIQRKKEQHFLFSNAEHKRKYKKGISNKKRPSSHKIENKKKIESDSEDDVKKNYYDSNKHKYSDLSDDDIPKPKKVFDKKSVRKFNTADFVKKKPKSELKMMIENGELERKNTFIPLDDDLKKKSLMSDVSEDEDDTKLEESDHKPKLIDESRVKLEKILSDTSENESITSYRFPKAKTCAIYSDDSEELETKPREKADELFFNLAELHNDFVKSENSSPPPLIDPMVYEVGDFQKKKSHKKKQKRQKSREHSMDRSKRHSKKERRKSIHSDVGEEDKEHKLKQKKKKKNRNKVKSIENLEEDIFGSMSDDSEKADARKLSKLSVSDVYDADSDSSNKDLREDDIRENAKPDVENKLLNSVENTNSYDNYFEHIKSKKKKRKKSKEEKSKHHHHHHHHHHNHHHTKHEDVPPALSLPCLIEPRSLEIGKEETKEEDDDKADDRCNEVVDIVTNSIAESHHEKLQMKDVEVANVEMKNVFTPLPSLDDNVHEKAVKSISNESGAEDQVHERAVKSIATSGVDSNIHERAVLSISNSLIDTRVEVKEPIPVEKPKIPAPVVDDKTGITISQEETEDAVAAILGESPEFGFDNECYPDDAMKPGTPNSEPDLQIDTDTEDVKSDVDNSFDISEPMSIENTIEKLEANIKAEEDDLMSTDTSVTSKTTSSVEISPPIVTEKELKIANSCDKIDSLVHKPAIDVPKTIDELVKSSDSLKEIAKLASDAVPKKSHVSEFVKAASPESKKENSASIVVNSQCDIIAENPTCEKLVPPSPPKVVIPSERIIEPVEKVKEDVCKDLFESATAPPLPPPPPEIVPTSKSDTLKNRQINSIHDHNNKAADRIIFNNFTSQKSQPKLDDPLYAPYKPNNVSHFDDRFKSDNAVSKSHPVLKGLSPIREFDKHVDSVEVTRKNKERKRSFAECNGPSSVIKHEQPITTEKPTIKLEPNSEPEPICKNEKSNLDVSPVVPAESTLIKVPTVDTPIKSENDPVEAPKDDPAAPATTLNDHTYNSSVNNPEKPEQLPEVEPKLESQSPQTVICEPEAEKQSESESLIEKDTKDDTEQSKDKTEPEALKQLQIPTANEKLLDVVDDTVKTAAECNEANKENIVKTIVNHDNFAESNDDTKLNVIVRNKERDIKEIAKTVEEEIFRSVPNELSKCNHRMPENNRNILEKVVQRIHESKRSTQKVEDSQNPELTRINLTDKVVLATEDEISSAKILLKMSESSVIKNKVSDYNCVIKIHDNPIPESDMECKLDLKESSAGHKKSEASSPGGVEPELNEDMSESADDGLTGSKLNDHSYNAKRGRRRKAVTPGGVVTRRGKQNNVVTKENETKNSFKIKKPTDVYEFKEDSEEEVKRPRLILTIKSPVEQTQPAPATPPTPPMATKEPSPPPAEIKPSNSNETTPTGVKSTLSANTRKSRRLQEKEGGSRNTVDDTIDEVIKSTANNQRPTRRTTRIAAAAAAAIITSVHESARKNSRTNRKSTSKSETALPSEASNTPAIIDEKDEFPSSPSIPTRVPSPIATPDSPISSKTPSEPTTLIDPVSGLLMPMKESDEGQYVPVLTELTQLQKSTECDYPPEKKPRLDDTVLEESAIPLVKNTPEPVITTPKLVTRSVISPKIPETAAVTTSVIASVPAATSVCVPQTTKSDNLIIPATPPAVIPAANVENEPISLIKNSTPSIIPAAASMKSHTPSLPYNQPSFPPVVYSQSQPVTKLHSSKTVTSQPRVLTPITPKAHIIQSLNLENDTHANDEVPYPPQYTSPLLHGAVASPPLGSPKISPQPIVSGASNARAAHPLKTMVPLEPLRIDPPTGYFYMPNTSPSSRPAIPVQSPSPQPRATSSLSTNILPHSGVQSTHYMPPQFMYQPYIPESSLTPYHIPPSGSSTAAATVIGSAKGIPEREVLESRPQQPTPQVVGNTPTMTTSPPLELRKKTSPHSRLNDSPLITSPYVQNTRTFFYDEPVQAHRPLPTPARIRVSTPPYASKVPPQGVGEPVDMYAPVQSRIHIDTSRYGSSTITSHEDVIDNEVPPIRQFTDASYGSHRPTQSTLQCPETELDYSRRRVVRLRGDDDIVASRDSSPSQMDSPPLGDSPPQGNLDGTVLVQMYPIIWQGLLALKNDQAAVQMHVVSGNTSVAYDALPTLQDGFQPLLRIAQRMRLEQPQLEQVNRKMEIRDEHCTILGLPCGRNQEDVVQQATNLESYIIPYLKQKKAAGIINVAAPGTQQAAFVVHVFPPCEFADNVLLNAAPDLYRRVQETAYLVCIIVTV